MDHPRSPRAARRLPIFALLGASAVSQVGNMMTTVAVPWFVLQTTGSAAKTGLTGAAIGLGAVLAAFLGGPVVDRLGFKRTSVLSDLMSGATVALIPLLHVAGVLSFWQLLVLVFLGSVLDAPGGSARDSLIPDLARLGGMPLERANSVDAAIPRLAQLAGPLAAGVLIAAIGASNVLLVDAATFAVSAALVTLAVPSVRRAPAEEAEGSAGYLTELLEGLRFVRINLLILSMISVATVANFLDTPLVSVILPVYASTVYGSPVGLGAMLGGFGAGALFGTLLFGAVGDRLPRRHTFILSFVIGPPLGYWALVAAPPLPFLVGTFVLAGLIGGPINPLYATVIQEHTPREMRGRVFGVLTALAYAGAPLGAALGGFLIEGLGLTTTVIGMGVVYLAVTASMFFNQALRQMDDAAEP